MARFQREKDHFTRNIWFSIVFCAGLMVLFYFGLSSISQVSLNEQEKSLKTALEQGTIRCYAVEGTYPESLEYLEKHYGISYDSDKFFVEYQVVGSNLLPAITVIPKNE